jgi:hypothetical protein
MMLDQDNELPLLRTRDNQYVDVNGFNYVDIDCVLADVLQFMKERREVLTLKQAVGSHEGRWLCTPQGEVVEIDCGIVDLIQMLWSMGIQTTSSCEDSGGAVWIAVPDIDTAIRFWKLADANHYLVDEALCRRILGEMQRMFPIAEEGWDVSWQGRYPYLLGHGGTLCVASGWSWGVSHVSAICCSFPCQLLPFVQARLVNQLNRRDINPGAPEPEQGCPVCSVSVPKGKSYCGASCEMTDTGEDCTQESDKDQSAAL